SPRSSPRRVRGHRPQRASLRDRPSHRGDAGRIRVRAVPFARASLPALRAVRGETGKNLSWKRIEGRSLGCAYDTVSHIVKMYDMIYHAFSFKYNHTGDTDENVTPTRAPNLGAAAAYRVGR